jgi:hypothetical protein
VATPSRASRSVVTTPGTPLLPMTVHPRTAANRTLP